MSSSALPPPSNLPSWSRVSTLDRSRYPKPFLRDRMPLPPTGTTITTDAMMDFNTSVKFLEKVSGQHQAVCYDKSIKFLQQQHSDTLMKLHEELDRLKRENKELQFKVVLAHSNNNSPNEISMTKTSFSPPSDIKTLLLQEEVKDLKQALRESVLKNSEMQQAMLSLQSRVDSARERMSGDGERSKVHRRKYSISNLSTSLPLNATLNPLQVRDSANESPRPPSMSECELIIQRLHEVNCQQLTELSRLRTDFRNVTLSQNSTPDASMTKIYGPGEHESFSDTRLPRIPTKPTTKKSIKSANSAEIKVSLPALKNTITTNVAERHKRQHALQKQKNSKSYQ